MVREVRGPGTLAPEHIRFITALAAGRVDRVLAQPGQHVKPETVLLDLSNPDVQIQRSEEHTSELQSQSNLVCRLLLEKKNKNCARNADSLISSWPGAQPI